MLCSTTAFLGLGRRAGVMLAILAATIAWGIFTPAMAGSIVLTGENDPEVRLDDLIGPDGDSLIVGDKIFDEFSYSVAPSDAPFAPDAEDVTVVALFEGENLFGIRFQAVFADFAIDDNPVDFLIGFDVTVDNPDFLISGVSLEANPEAGGPAPAFAEIVETVTDAGGNLLGGRNLEVEDLAGDLPPTVGSDSITFTPQSTISVLKDVALLAVDSGEPGGNGVNSTISFIDQVFTQVPSEIPEPTTAVLAGIAAGLGLTRRRSQSGR